MADDKKLTHQEFGEKIAKEVYLYLNSRLKEEKKLSVENGEEYRLPIFAGAVLEAVLEVVDSVSPNSEIFWAVVTQSLSSIATRKLAEEFKETIGRIADDNKEGTIH